MPDIRYLLRHGDPTSTGGYLIAIRSDFLHHGVAIGIEGDAATCPACKSSGPVLNNCKPNYGYNGTQVLVSGARVCCKCAQSPVVINTQTDSSVEVERCSRGPMSYASSMPSATDKGAFAIDHNDRYMLLDSESQEPIRKAAYAIRRMNGELEFGITDAAGCTHLLASVAKAEDVEVYLEG